MSKAIVVYGGQYGSEGKASAAEYWAMEARTRGDQIAVIGENSPNSGHTCSLGSTRNIPASSFFADAILLGPDSVVDEKLLVSDWEKTGCKPLFVHENAAFLDDECRSQERSLVERISSTGSGSGKARGRKFIDRDSRAIVKGRLSHAGIEVVDTAEWMKLVKQAYCRGSVIMECSQGLMLDPNLGRYPFCTSRSTSPRVAVERNALGWIPWQFAGVYRTYPIRTGGPSGSTGGNELQWMHLGEPEEITTVTKRIRRVFEFSHEEFALSLEIARPDILMFTFLDYLGIADLNAEKPVFKEWLDYYGIEGVTKFPVYVSNKTGKFVPFGE